MDYKQTALEIVKYVGGHENITHLGHCSTRLRISLADNKKADIKALEALPGVIAVRMTGQCQIVIGNDVVEVYEQVHKLVGEPNQPDSDQQVEKKKIGPLVLDFIVGVFQPLVPAIAGGGILKSLLLLLALIGVMEKESQSYQILNLIGDAPLYFLPLLVAVTAANKLRVNSLVALSAVGALLLPSMATLLQDGAQLFSFSLTNIAYAYQVFPAILTVLLYAQIEKLFTKISPKPIRIFFVPMMSLLITVPIALLLLGPLGYTFGQGFASVILWVFDHVGWLAVALLACVLPFMVATGMHKAMIPYAVTTMGSLGREALYLPASLAHNFAESGACFAIALRTKDKRLRTTAISGGISAFFGITEPALYGVTLQNKKVLASVMIGSFIGGSFVGIIGIQAFVLVGPGLASMSMFLSEDLSRNFLYAVIGLILSFAAAFVSAFIMGKDKKAVHQEEETFAQNISNGETFTSPVAGKMIPLTKVHDEVFSSKAMGDGLAIIPTKGELFAPVDGEISMLFDSYHALGMRTDNGAEILFHVGLNTVELGGEHFTPQVQVGSRVKAGDLLLTFDLEKIKAAGFDPVTMAIVTNSDQYDFQINQQENVTRQDKLMVLTQIGG